LPSSDRIGGQKQDNTVFKILNTFDSHGATAKICALSEHTNIDFSEITRYFIIPYVHVFARLNNDVFDVTLKASIGKEVYFGYPNANTHRILKIDVKIDKCSF